MPIVHGVSPSPFVRKVRVFLREKGIDHELKLVAPFGITDEFRKISPLGKIPVYEEGDFTTPDSSVICAYLERTHPEPPLYPAAPKDYARALWFEEYADTKLADQVGPVFFERAVKPKMLKQQTDEGVVQQALAGLPAFLDYLEAQVGERDFIVGNGFSIADIAIATQLQQLVHGGEPVDATRWPRLARYASGILGRPSFRALIEEDDRMFGSG
jgi:glutathione S-transferase